MTDEKPKSLAEMGCTSVVTAGDVHVAFADDVKPSFDELSDKVKGRFRRIMEMWCHGHKLTPEMFNYNEGRSPKKTEWFRLLRLSKFAFTGSITRFLRGVFLL